MIHQASAFPKLLLFLIQRRNILMNRTFVYYCRRGIYVLVGQIQNQQVNNIPSSSSKEGKSSTSESSVLIMIPSIPQQGHRIEIAALKSQRSLSEKTSQQANFTRPKTSCIEEWEETRSLGRQNRNYFWIKSQSFMYKQLHKVLTRA